METPYGAVQVKVARREGKVVNAAPEFDDCQRLATEKSVPLKQVMPPPKPLICRQTEKAPSDMKTFFLTTPIYYPNARPACGFCLHHHCVRCLARYKRMCGYDVAFLTGTDEHGEKLERAAAAAGKSPHEFVAEKRKLFVALWEKLGIPVKVYPDSDPTSLRFIYTDHPDHVISVQRLLIRARENGYIFTRSAMKAAIAFPMSAMFPTTPIR